MEDVYISFHRLLPYLHHIPALTNREKVMAEGK